MNGIHIKNVVIDASLGKDSRSEIPENLVGHEVGILINEYFDNNNQELLEVAASKLTGGSEKPWLWLLKS